MKKILTTALSTITLSFALAGNIQAATVADVELQPSIAIEQAQLNYYGAGIRSKFFMKLYVGSLYAAKEGLSAEAIVAGDSVAAVRLNILSGMITSERMIDTIEEGFDKASDGDTAPLQERINNFVAVFDQAIVVGDQFTLVSLPGKGVEAYKNGQLLTVVEGDDFRKTLLAIWLGDDPADDDLKDGMMGN